jgi:hypothetical protein
VEFPSGIVVKEPPIIARERAGEEPWPRGTSILTSSAKPIPFREQPYLGRKTTLPMRAEESSIAGESTTSALKFSLKLGPLWVGLERTHELKKAEGDFRRAILERRHYD